MVHWYSSKERGTIVSTWNTAHNIGGALSANIASLGVVMFSVWQANLYFPAYIALGVSFITFLLMKDTPQSEGLPSVEEYKNDYHEDYQEKYEHEFSTKEIFIDYVLKNKFLWYIALANVFVYFIRYGLIDWAPTYLRETNHYQLQKVLGLMLYMNMQQFQVRFYVVGCLINYLVVLELQ